MTNEEILAKVPKGCNGMGKIEGESEWVPMHNSMGIVRSVDDMRRIVELEKEVKKWQKWHLETSQTLSEVCGKAEAAERERDDEVNKVQSLIEKRAERAGSHARENFITFMKSRVGGSSINHIVLMISDRLVNQQYESDHVATVINELLKLVSERAKEK